MDAKDDPRHPRVLQALFNIPEPRYVILAVRSKARKGDWGGIKNLIPSSPGFNDYWKSRLGLEPFLEVHIEYEGPTKDFDMYASMISNERERYDVCLKYELYEVGVETVQALKEPDLYIELAHHIYKKLGDTERSRRLRQFIDDRINIFVKESKSLLSFDEGSTQDQAQEIANAWQNCPLYKLE